MKNKIGFHQTHQTHQPNKKNEIGFYLLNKWNAISYIVTIISIIFIFISLVVSFISLGYQINQIKNINRNQSIEISQIMARNFSQQSEIHILKFQLNALQIKLEDDSK